MASAWHRFPGQLQRLTICALFTYLTAILLLCLTPAMLNIASTHKVLFHFLGVPYNAIPFQGISPEFLLNIVMTIPWGVFLYLIAPHRSLAWLTAACLSFSLFIEVNQFVWDLLIDLGRLADIDDLITNTLGGLLGFLLVALLNRTKLRALINRFRL